MSNSELALKIKNELIDKNYYDEVNENIIWRNRWKRISDISETSAHILTGIAAILSFAAGFFNSEYYSFTAGGVGTTSLVLTKFSNYAMSESKERTSNVNKILNKLGLDGLTDNIEIINKN